ncbi:hypothetical protein PR048_011165 [Dryococelus australis]|uniref:HTH psq-type domain-containing protein n=1 Tax=Dryococelus australis TaxID=614101 RepID=A0ABQ9HKV0_9NEOP|nr:hypothetical protein PR048_011165 [Dryococelus australis]
MPPIKGKMLDYSSIQMEKALQAVERGLPFATSAKLHGVPRAILMYKRKGCFQKIVAWDHSLFLVKNKDYWFIGFCLLPKLGFQLLNLSYWTAFNI